MSILFPSLLNPNYYASSAVYSLHRTLDLSHFSYSFYPLSLVDPPFVFPNDRLHVASAPDISFLRPSDLENIVKGVAFDLSDKVGFCVGEHGVFYCVYSLVKGFWLLGPSSNFNFVETLWSNLGVLLPSMDSLSRAHSSPSPVSDRSRVADVVDRIASHRKAIKIYTFFLLDIVLAEESAVVSAAQENAKVKPSFEKP